MTATLELPKKQILPLLLKISAVAKHLAVSRQTVHNMILSGDLEAYRVNANTSERQHVRISRDSLLKFYKKRFGHSLVDALANAFQP
jgi:excisionase family DNA binding protein